MGVIQYNSACKSFNGAIYACGDDEMYYYPIFGKDGKVYIGNLDDKEGKPLVEFERATDEMREVALFNYVACDNYKSQNKTGVYRLTINQLKDAFSDAMYKVETGRMDAESFKKYFALAEENQYMKKCVDTMLKETVGKYAKEEEQVA